MIADGWKTFASRDELARTLARDVADTLSEAIKRRGTGLLAVSGGSTPANMFRVLANADIDWSKVTIILVDERFVPETSSRSNAAMVRATLLQGKAKAARFVPLYQPLESVEDAAAQASAVLEELPWPMDMALLGMGLDGHTASFFSDAVNLDDLLLPDGDSLVLTVHSLTAGERRLTLPLSRIIAAGRIALHIEGQEKRTVLEAAIAPGGNRPISAIFREVKKPIDIYWAS